MLVCAIGVFIAVVFAIIPVGTDFGNDPLLRLRELDPELSPPNPTAECGSPISNLNPAPEGTSLFELARAHACGRAAERRLAAAVAAGGVLFMVGLLGLAGPRLEREPSQTPARGLLSHRENVGGHTAHRHAQ